MAEQIVKKNPLKVFEEQIALAKGVKDILKTTLVKDRYVANFQGISGRADGAQVFEQESFAFIDLANNKPEIMACDAFSIVAGFLKASTYPLSFSGNDLAVYPRNIKQKDGSFKSVLIVEPMAHGKRRLIENMKGVKEVPEAIIVFHNDAFEADVLNEKVILHKQTWPRPEATEATVVGVYVRIKHDDGTFRDIIMDQHEIKKARLKSKMANGGELWTTHYGEAVKKTVYNRAFKVVYKKPKSDAMFQQFEGPEEESDLPFEPANVVEEQKQGEQQSDFNPNVNESTGEVYEKTEEVKTSPKKDKAKKSEEPFI